MGQGQWLVIGGHCARGTTFVGDRCAGRRFAAANLFVEADEKSNNKNTLANARKKIGPPRCWFTRTADVHALGCNTEAFAEDWANRVLRVGSQAHGTIHFMFGTWRTIARATRSANIRFTRDLAGNMPINDEVATTLAKALTLAPGWESSSGKQ